MPNHMLQQARQAIQNLGNGNRKQNDEEIQSIQSSIQAAYEQCSPEEEQELRELEAKLQQHHS
ncbi:hypothetical protein CEY16_00805 [Halalkalibacillus sediminis]|uniref:DUF3813 domain-containing protein n=1 Tax=Halalkalibacillus sediminis TaxID=2018042 RepID=A0A2I0QW44_9BACI|nr:DUF3813 family protein [Halalkalibacillus sediminis]PKR78330.1 hypothetical protein CEY16_00805 [Halalkalibacillus sediminis]